MPPYYVVWIQMLGKEGKAYMNDEHREGEDVIGKYAVNYKG